jgi:regulator of cell morphogenesis and NO signaling
MQESASLQTKEALDKTIGEFVAEDYRTATVFEKYGVDFCCGGQVTLSATCREKGLDPAAIQREIELVKSEPVTRSQNYAAWELSFLADYIVNTHHAYLNENTGQIAAYAHKIAEVHGAHHPEVIEIATIFDKIAADMVGHLREEEEVLFPMVKRVDAARKTGTPPEAKDRAAIKASLEKLGHEHEEIGDAIHAIRHLAKDYAIPDDVCNTFVVTYQKLKEFEDDLHKHVHLENNILFLKAATL